MTYQVSELLKPKVLEVRKLPDRVEVVCEDKSAKDGKFTIHVSPQNIAANIRHNGDEYRPMIVAALIDAGILARHELPGGESTTEFIEPLHPCVVALLAMTPPGTCMCCGEPLRVIELPSSGTKH